MCDLGSLLLLGGLPGRGRGHDADVVHEAEVGGGHDEESRECCAPGRVEGRGEVPVGVVVEAVGGQDGLHRGRCQPADDHDARLQSTDPSSASEPFVTGPVSSPQPVSGLAVQHVWDACRAQA